METIWKFQLEPATALQCVEMPKGAKILSLQTQNNIPCIWALVNPDKNVEEEERIFVTHGTGDIISTNNLMQMQYIATYQIDEGEYVFHVFEKFINR